ncbi:putative secreted protein [Wickerhamomyces ciferrii]|uniref:Secreted protein n=1 Tax=Wickerhamomyces ciferrii (strain ATCC 14091 / BCRC 22168 / CBS 111 / JCM 3599 / NBRC 0793 / NRRL Y-1031 F-60-10) TaxID=1206466 RepID=K0KSN5_WICCF|nr:uncharacterized protein BN7_5760 [Wickerhamomyces ciferrii]CCH46171.1 putative secreted protein [Wickerhamomyces ciferrii]
MKLITKVPRLSSAIALALMSFAVLSSALVIPETNNTMTISSLNDATNIDYSSYIVNDAEYSLLDASDYLNIDVNVTLRNMLGDEADDIYSDEESYDDSINAAAEPYKHYRRAKRVHSIFQKKKPKNYNKSPIIDAIAKDSGLPKKKIIQRIDKNLKVYSGEVPAVKCKDTKRGYGGLCVNTQNRAVYRNEDRASHHWMRSYFFPAQVYTGYVISHWWRWINCTIPLNGVILDMVYCQLWKWENEVIDVLFGVFASIGYQEVTGKPFAPVATTLLSVYGRIGYKMTGYKAVSWTGEVVDLNKTPAKYDLQYIYAGYGDPEWDSRNVSMAIYPGNKASELGLSVVSKPWDPAPQRGIGVPNPVDDLFKKHWKYSLKLDTDQIRFNLDQRSPEETLHKVRTFVQSQVRNYMALGGGMLTNNHIMFINPDDVFGDNVTEPEEDFSKYDDDLSLINKIGPNPTDEELLNLNFNGVILRVTLEDHAEHTINW